MPTQTIKEVRKEIEEILNPEPKKPKLPFWSLLCALFFLFMIGFGVFLGIYLSSSEEAGQEAENLETAPSSFIQKEILDLDGESRSGEKLEAVRDIAVHYVANPGSTAMQNREYFNGPDSSTSSHFIIGLSGEVIQCIPLDEKSCATNFRNIDTISIEVCHPDKTGKFLPETRESLVRLLGALLAEFDLSRENIIRHYDVTGKMCPLYYVENPEEWEALRNDAALFAEREEAIDFD